MSFQFNPSFNTTRQLLASVTIASSLLLATCMAITPVPTPAQAPYEEATAKNLLPLKPIVKPPIEKKPIVVVVDDDNISLQSILKPEQQKSPEALAVGGIDSYIAEKSRSTSSDKSNLWQVVLALLTVSAGAWWLLNTAWFKALAQQKEVQLQQKNGAYVSRPATNGLDSWATSTTALASPLQKASQWVTSLLSPEATSSGMEEQPMASILQTLPLPGGQYLVVLKIGTVCHNVITGGQQPLLLETWVANTSPLAEPASAEKWMAQTPPAPTPASKKEAVSLHSEILTDYEALSENEEALFEQLLKTEKGIV